MTAAQVRAVLTVTLIVFLVLKLANVVNWSWWVITAPMWAPLLLGLCWFALLALVTGIAGLAGLLGLIVTDAKARRAAK